MPSAGKLLNLVVKCEGAPGSGKTFTWKASIERTTRRSPDMRHQRYARRRARTMTQTTRSAFDADDTVTFKVTTTGGTATARDCVIGVQVAGAGEATPPPTPDHSLILFGDATAVSPRRRPALARHRSPRRRSG